MKIETKFGSAPATTGLTGAEALTEAMELAATTQCSEAMAMTNSKTRLAAAMTIPITTRFVGVTVKITGQTSETVMNRTHSTAKVARVIYL